MRLPAMVNTSGIHPRPLLAELKYGNISSCTPCRTAHAGVDLLRAAAILWVMLFHARSLHLPFAAAGTVWLDGFGSLFVLSGYLIGLQLLKPYLRGVSPRWPSFTCDAGSASCRFISSCWPCTLPYGQNNLCRRSRDVLAGGATISAIAGAAAGPQP
jgi:hypothetical protein